MAVSDGIAPPSLDYGVNTSLYGPLPAASRQDLGRMHWLKATGRVQYARAIFDNELGPFQHIPIVAIEHADLELEAGRWGRAWSILDNALTTLKSFHADLSRPEHRLMSLTWAMLGIRHRGDLGSAVRELERTRQWLWDVPVEEYTDVQTSCIRRYVIAYLLTRLSSSYEDPDVESVPRSEDSPGPTGSRKMLPWSGLAKLRRSLVARGMIREALALFRVELNRTPLTDRDPIVREVLSVIECLPTDSWRFLFEATVRLQWYTHYTQISDVKRALQERDASEAAFERFCDEFNVSDRHEAPHSQALLCEKFTSTTDPTIKLRFADHIIATLDQIDSSKTGSCIEIAAEAAMVRFTGSGEPEFLEKFYQLHRQLARYDETVSGDLCDLVRHQDNVVSTALVHLVDRQKCLEWTDGFLKRFPYFAAPAELKLLYDGRASLLRGLRKLDEAKKEEEKAEILGKVGPSMGKWMNCNLNHSHTPQVALPSHRMTGSLNEADGMSLTRLSLESVDRSLSEIISSEARVATNLLAHIPEAQDTDVPFYYPWDGTIGDSGKVRGKAVNLLLEWSVKDVISGLLSIHDLFEMTDVLNLPPHEPCNEEEMEAIVEKIKDGHQRNLHALLFPTDGGFEAQQEGRCRRISEWLLSTPPSTQRNHRVFCLMMLRDARQQHFSDMRHWKLRIVELCHLVELHPSLPLPIRSVFPLARGSWLSALALSHTALLENESDSSGIDIPGVIAAAERYNELAVAEMQIHPQPVQLALQQRVGAELCIERIQLLKLKLNQFYGQPKKQETVLGQLSALDPLVIKSEIRKPCEIGLERVRQTQNIYTESEVQASQAYGLQGINDRHNLAAFHSTAHTANVAIYLLLEEPDGYSEKTILEVWQWVQSYKARSLARTIGMGSQDPHGLVTSILASKECRALYEKMLSLQQELEKASLSVRFDLRRELDQHRRKMKEVDLLRRLMDLREGTPIDLSDIEEMTREIGTSVVFVDWFFLPPNSSNSGVARFLLLTARAGSTPTLDVLATKKEDVTAWQEKFLFGKHKLEHTNARTAFDETLRGLVAPLSHRTRPDDVLVLCPSAMLHGLPLHALLVSEYFPEDDDIITIPLIRRNPVVYIHSHSLFRSCFSAARNACSSSLAAMNPKFLSGISETAATAVDVKKGRRANFTAGRKSIGDLAEQFGTYPMIDGTASKKHFMDVVSQSRLLHLQTHCGWNSSDPLGHCLEFPRPDGIEMSGEDLTARELFDVKLLPGTHFSMMACQGGVTDVKPGDEVLGLVPVLMYSGASSTISTLWSIADSDGAQFAEEFFNEFVLQAKALGSDKPSRPGDKISVGFVDIAVALQKAVNYMEKEEYNTPLYSWAGFVMHGFWQYPLLGEDANAPV